LKHATNLIQQRYLQAEKPAAQTAHLFFPNAPANAQKNKRADPSHPKKKPVDLM